MQFLFYFLSGLALILTKINQRLGIQFIFLFLLPFGAISQNPNCEVEYFTRKCIKNKDNIETVDTVVLLIKNRLGEKYCHVILPDSKKIISIKAWIEDSNGNIIRKLKNDEIKEESDISDFSLYEDTYIKTFNLKHNVYPYRILYTFKRKEKYYFSLAAWSPQIHKELQSKKAVLTVEYPKDFSVKIYKKGNYKENSQIIENNQISKYSIENVYNELPDDIYSKEPDDFFPKIIIQPTEFYYGIKGSAANWIEYANWFYTLNDNLLELPEPEKKILAQLIEGKTNKRLIVKCLYDYLKNNFRYINVSQGIGGFQANSALEVVKNKYGDCKGLTNCMKAFLNYAGIDSYFALLDRSEIPENIIYELPSPQFNHVVLCVPIGKDTIWLENTEQNEPFGYVNYSIQNRKALLIKKNESKFVNTPFYKEKDVEQIRNIELLIKCLDSTFVDAKCVFKGKNYSLFNSLQKEYSKDIQDKYIRNYLPYTGFEIINWKLVPSQKDSAKIEVLYKSFSNKFINALGSDYYINTVPITSMEFESPDKRKLPLYFHSPISKIDTVEYDLPKKFQNKTTINPTKIESEFGRYEIICKYNNHKILIIKKLELYQGEYSLEKYKEFHSFYSKIHELDNKVIIFKTNT